MVRAHRAMFNILYIRGVFDKKLDFFYKSQKKGHRKIFFVFFLNLITHYPHALCMVVRQLVVGLGKLLNIDVLCDPIPT